MEGKLKAIIKFWDDYAPEFDEAHATENLVVWKAALVELIGQDPNQKVLDVGTGTGFLAKLLAEVGYAATGVDMAVEMLKIAREDTASKGLNVTYMEAAVESMPFDDNCFDAVVNCRLVWTLTDPQLAFGEWLRILKPGGKLFSFIRLKDGRDTNITTVYGEELDHQLPLKNAGADELMLEYEKTGFTDCSAVELSSELTTKGDYSPWYVIIGKK